MVGDVNHELASAYEVLDDNKGIAYRGIYLIDPNGEMRYISVHDLSVGRSVDELLRVLDALQTDKLCPCNWKAGQETLN